MDIATSQLVANCNHKVKFIDVSSANGLVSGPLCFCHFLMVFLWLPAQSKSGGAGEDLLAKIAST